eukprot:jgi/Mesen1/9211/ME000591S08543
MPSASPKGLPSNLSALQSYNQSETASSRHTLWYKNVDVDYEQLQKYWNDLSVEDRRELLRLDKQSLFEQVRKNLYCSRCHGLLVEGFNQITQYGKNLHAGAPGGQANGSPGKINGFLLGGSGPNRTHIGRYDDTDDPAVHPWGGLAATKDSMLTVMDCFIKGMPLDVLQHVFECARQREHERELLYPDACGGGDKGWMVHSSSNNSNSSHHNTHGHNQTAGPGGRAHNPKESCALHTARLSCEALVDFWSALGEETRRSLLRMKEEDFIERLMFRFENKRFCRDCRRNVLREFKEMKELKRLRKEPRCTRWFCAADTAFRYEVTERTLQADWHDCFLGDAASMYQRFEWALGTAEGKADILPFEDVGLSESIQVEGIDIAGRTVCFITVRGWKRDGRSNELWVKAYGLKGQLCVHRRLLVGDRYVSITKGESIQRFFERAEEAEEEEDTWAQEEEVLDKDGGDLEGEGVRPQKHAKSPELARDFLLDAATVIFKEQVEKAFREGTARQNAHSIFVCLALSLLEQRVRVACKEISALERQQKLLEEEEEARREEEERKERKKQREKEKKMRRKEKFKAKGDKGKPDSLSGSVADLADGADEGEEGQGDELDREDAAGGEPLLTAGGLSRESTEVDEQRAQAALNKEDEGEEAGGVTVAAAALADGSGDDESWTGGRRDRHDLQGTAGMYTPSYDNGAASHQASEGGPSGGLQNGDGKVAAAQEAHAVRGIGAGLGGAEGKTLSPAKDEAASPSPGAPGISSGSGSSKKAQSRKGSKAAGASSGGAPSRKDGSEGSEAAAAAASAAGARPPASAGAAKGGSSSAKGPAAAAPGGADRGRIAENQTHSGAQESDAHEAQQHHSGGAPSQEDYEGGKHAAVNGALPPQQQHSQHGQKAGHRTLLPSSSSRGDVHVADRCSCGDPACSAPFGKGHQPPGSRPLLPAALGPGPGSAGGGPSKAGGRGKEGAQPPGAYAGDATPPGKAAGLSASSSKSGGEKAPTGRAGARSCGGGASASAPASSPLTTGALPSSLSQPGLISSVGLGPPYSSGSSSGPAGAGASAVSYGGAPPPGKAGGGAGGVLPGAPAGAAAAAAAAASPSASRGLPGAGGAKAGQAPPGVHGYPGIGPAGVSSGSSAWVPAVAKAPGPQGGLGPRTDRGLLASPMKGPHSAALGGPASAVASLGPSAGLAPGMAASSSQAAAARRGTPAGVLASLVAPSAGGPGVGKQGLHQGPAAHMSPHGAHNAGSVNPILHTAPRGSSPAGKVGSSRGGPLLGAAPTPPPPSPRHDLGSFGAASAVSGIGSSGPLSSADMGPHPSLATSAAAAAVSLPSPAAALLSPGLPGAGIRNSVGWSPGSSGASTPGPSPAKDHPHRRVSDPSGSGWASEPLPGAGRAEGLHVRENGAAPASAAVNGRPMQQWPARVRNGMLQTPPPPMFFRPGAPGVLPLIVPNGGLPMPPLPSSMSGPMPPHNVNPSGGTRPSMSVPLLPNGMSPSAMHYHAPPGDSALLGRFQGGTSHLDSMLLPSVGSSRAGTSAEVVGSMERGHLPSQTSVRARHAGLDLHPSIMVPPGGGSGREAPRHEEEIFSAGPLGGFSFFSFENSTPPPEARRASAEIAPPTKKAVDNSFGGERSKLSAPGSSQDAPFHPPIIRQGATEYSLFSSAGSKGFGFF